MKTYKLREITKTIVDGKHGDCIPDEDSGYYFISCKNIHDGMIDYNNARQIEYNSFVEAFKRTALQASDILITNSGTIGRMAFVQKSDKVEKTAFQKSVAVVRPDTSIIDAKYLYYDIQNCIGRMAELSNGSAQKNLLLSTMREFDIDIHTDLPTQHRIASILSAYDDLIENNRRQIKLLEEAAQRLFREWFVELRFPGHENVKIVDGVPEGWKAETVGNVCSTIGGGTPSTKEKSYYEGGNIPWVTPTDITHNGCLILLETEKKITKEGLAHSSAKMVPAWTILMTSRASVGYFGMCEFPVCTNQGFISCIPYQENMRFYLLHNLMNRVDEIRAKAGGSTYLEISKSTFRDMKIIVPADEILYLFEESIQKLMMKTKNCKEQIGILTSARDRLLPKLMSGEMEVFYDG